MVFDFLESIYNDWWFGELKLVGGEGGGKVREVEITFPCKTILKFITSNTNGQLLVLIDL